MKRKYIENHFLLNPSWKILFISKYPNWEVSSWVEDSWKLFKDNNYTVEIERYKTIDAVKYITLFDSTGDDIAQMCDLSSKNALEQLIIHIICDHIVDFSKFK